MPVVVDEAWDSGSGRHDNAARDDGVTLTFNVVGTESEEEAHEEARNYLPAYHRHWPFRSYSLDYAGGDVFHVRADYGYGSPGATKVRVTTRGGTRHVTQAIDQTVYDDSGEMAADPFTGAINVSGDSVEGVDIVSPQLHFTEEHAQPYDTVIQPSFLNGIVGLTGTVNAETFRGFQPGEVLFLGADWEYEVIDVPEPDPDLKVLVTYEFAASPNKDNFEVGGITVDEKWGHDYLWVRYKERKVDGVSAILKVPAQVAVASVYEEESWGDLQI